MCTNIDDFQYQVSSEHIGTNVFGMCEKLTEVRLPVSLKQLNEAFRMSLQSGERYGVEFGQ